MDSQTDIWNPYLNFHKRVGQNIASSINGRFEVQLG